MRLASSLAEVCVVSEKSALFLSAYLALFTPKFLLLLLKSLSKLINICSSLKSALLSVTLTNGGNQPHDLRIYKSITEDLCI